MLSKEQLQVTDGGHLNMVIKVSPVIRVHRKCGRTRNQRADSAEICIWLYHTFCLSFRDVELLLAERGVVISYETIRRWCRKFAQTFANRLRRRRPRPGDHWHLDEVFIRINGVQHYLWRAVDQDGVVLDVLVQSRRNTRAIG